MILPAGAEDFEFESDSLQAGLCAIIDGKSVVELARALDTPTLQDRRRRVVELRDRSVSHDWLMRLSRAHGPVVPRGEF